MQSQKSHVIMGFVRWNYNWFHFEHFEIHDNSSTLNYYIYL